MFYIYLFSRARMCFCIHFSYSFCDVRARFILLFTFLFALLRRQPEKNLFFPHLFSLLSNLNRIQISFVSLHLQSPSALLRFRRCVIVIAFNSLVFIPFFIVFGITYANEIYKFNLTQNFKRARSDSIKIYLKTLCKCIKCLLLFLWKKEKKGSLFITLCINLSLNSSNSISKSFL